MRNIWAWVAGVVVGGFIIGLLGAGNLRATTIGQPMWSFEARPSSKPRRKCRQDTGW